MENINPNITLKPSCYPNIKTSSISKNSNKICNISLSPSSSLIEDQRNIIINILSFNINNIKTFKLPIVIETSKSLLEKKLIEIYSFKDITKLGNILIFSLNNNDNNNINIFQCNYNDEKKLDIKINIKITKATDKLGYSQIEVIEGKIVKIGGIQRIKLYSQSNKHVVGEVLVETNYQLLDDDDDVSEAPLTPMTPMPASSSSIVTPVNAPVILSSKVSPVLLSVNKTITRAVHRQPWKSLVLLVLSLLLCFLIMTGKTVNNDTLSLSSSILVDINDIANDAKLQWVSSLLWGDVKFVNTISKHQWLLVPDQVGEDTFMIKHSINHKCLSQSLHLKKCQNLKNRWKFKDNLLIASNGYILSGNEKLMMSNKEKDKKILVNVVSNEKKFTNIVIMM